MKAQELLLNFIETLKKNNKDLLNVFYNIEFCINAVFEKHFEKVEDKPKEIEKLLKPSARSVGKLMRKRNYYS